MEETKDLLTFNNSGFKKINAVPLSLNKIFTQLFSERQTLTLLDFGCGYGSWIEYLFTHYKSFYYQVYDIDSSAENHAKNLFPEYYNSQTDKFDIILVFALLELFSYDEQKKLLLKLKNKIKSNGRIILQYNVYNILSLRWILFYILSLGKPIQHHEKRKFHRSYLTIKEVEKLCQESGYSIEDWGRGYFYTRFPTWLNNFVDKLIKSKKFYPTIFYVLKSNT